MCVYIYIYIYIRARAHKNILKHSLNTSANHACIYVRAHACTNCKYNLTCTQSRKVECVYGTRIRKLRILLSPCDHKLQTRYVCILLVHGHIYVCTLDGYCYISFSPVANEQKFEGISMCHACTITGKFTFWLK